MIRWHCIARQCFFLSLLPCYCATGQETPSAPSRQPSEASLQRLPIVLTERAKALHDSCLVIDGHNDLPWELRKQGSSDLKQLDIAKPQPSLQTDLPRLRQGGLKAQFWSVWVPVDTMEQRTSLATTLEQIQLVHAMVAKYPDQLELALTASDIERISGQGKIASLIGVEGGYSIEESLANLHRLFDLGARYMTLTHTANLSWADSGTDVEEHGGLTPFGEAIVEEMNRMGMMVDLSHVSIGTMEDALRVSRAPVIFSHSSARGVADHPRNVPDEILKQLKTKDGVVMVNFFSAFIVPEAAKISSQRYELERKLKSELRDEAKVKSELSRWSAANPYERGTIHHLLDHIDHIAKVAGVEHVGLGSDYDGVTKLPEQLDDVTSYPLITQGLLDRGYSDKEIRGILGGNLIRVMRQVEAVAKSSPTR